jgi:drug/metabolite transporter (DMT)-like permease
MTIDSRRRRLSPQVARPSPGWLPLAMLLLLGTLWGASFSISKIAIQAGVTPLGYAFWQSFGPAALLILIGLLRGERLPLTRRHLLYYFVAGQLGLSIPNITFYFVIEHIPAGLMAVVVTFAPVITYLMALLIGMEAFRLQRGLGVLLGLSGALLLILPETSLPSPELLSWVLLAFITPTFYALNSIYSAKARPPDGHSLSLAAGMLAGAAVVQTPVVIFLGDFYMPFPPFGVADAALLAQVVLSSLAYVLFLEILRLAGPVFFSQVGYIVTLTGLLWGAFFFDERHSLWIYGATLMIISGVALVNWRSGTNSRLK